MPGTMAVPGTGSEATVVTQQIPGVIPTPIQASSQQKVARPDRLEVGPPQLLLSLPPPTPSRCAWMMYLGTWEPTFVDTCWDGTV